MSKQCIVKTVAQIICLTVAVGMIVLGLQRGEGGVVLTKAIKLCLECVGIG